MEGEISEQGWETKAGQHIPVLHTYLFLYCLHAKEVAAQTD
jgi:hypothetical protein